MNKIDFIYRVSRKLFRNTLDNLLTFSDSHSKGISSMPYRFNRFLNNFYNIDNNIEFYIRNGNNKFIR